LHGWRCALDRHCDDDGVGERMPSLVGDRRGDLRACGLSRTGEKGEKEQRRCV